MCFSTGKDNLALLALQSPDQTLPPHQALQDPPALCTHTQEPSSSSGLYILLQSYLCVCMSPSPVMSFWIILHPPVRHQYGRCSRNVAEQKLAPSADEEVWTLSSLPLILCSTCFICIFSSNSHHHPTRWILLSSPFANEETKAPGTSS